MGKSIHRKVRVMTETTDTTCPICGEQDTEIIPLAEPPKYNGINRRLVPHRLGKGKQISCESCGDFIITDKDQKDELGDKAYLAHTQGDGLAKLSALIREMKIQKRPPPWIQFQSSDKYCPLLADYETEEPHHYPVHFDELLKGWPETVPEKLNRTLCNLARMTKKGGDFLGPNQAVCFALDSQEASYHLNCLSEQGYIDHSGCQSNPGTAIVRAEGWERFDELTRGDGSPENPVFVAMWYGGKDPTTQAAMEALYDQGIEPAIREAGYKATRVDLEAHNDFIMNKVLGDIRVAPFMVADFTGNRGGVYLEAGFARGLGKEVIHTCRDDQFKDSHFDIQQINTLKWKAPEDLQEKLLHHIRGTIGEGPIKPDEETPD